MPEVTQLLSVTAGICTLSLRTQVPSYPLKGVGPMRRVKQMV